MDPTTMMQISTQMPQGSVDESWTERNTNESLFVGLGDCEDGIFVVTVNSIMLAISFCGLVANALVLWLLGFCVKRNPFSVYILNLAGADFFYLCSQIVRSITLIRHDLWDIGPTFIFTVTFFFYTLGLSFLAAISTERCLSVLFPIWYRCRRPKHTSATVCFLFWTLYLLGNLLEGFACGLLVLMPSSIMSCLAWDFSFVTLILFLVCLLCVSSLTLLLKFQCHAQHRAPSKLYLLILFTVLMFLLCGLPLGIYWFLLYWLINTRTLT
ncbi:mas-related G-protein coupled receptor member X2-like [Trichosurus vulpecula]|uniref:mas-related G-protein coupled receptor member X2-like n=1 Tax=Trichosurus vulpecula TaxID=9337 RepID=UPI00186AD0A1|nr:mas-related G-protein coupled receptor member X2-like [Trichosurus vulpecula]